MSRTETTLMPMAVRLAAPPCWRSRKTTASFTSRSSSSSVWGMALHDSFWLCNHTVITLPHNSLWPLLWVGNSNQSSWYTFKMRMITHWKIQGGNKWINSACSKNLLRIISYLPNLVPNIIWKGEINSPPLSHTQSCQTQSHLLPWGSSGPCCRCPPLAFWCHSSWSPCGGST